jgi:hypothetical protein
LLLFGLFGCWAAAIVSKSWSAKERVDSYTLYRGTPPRRH